MSQGMSQGSMVSHTSYVRWIGARVRVPVAPRRDSASHSSPKRVDSLAEAEVVFRFIRCEGSLKPAFIELMWVL